ncbi:MAG: thiamine pyrophosphate-binding protein [Candidatus Bathyarchaeia archaeon]
MSVNLKVSEVIVRFLEKIGVNLMFGLPGSQTCPLYDSLFSSSIRHVLVRHEQSAAYMADAYAKFTGNLGVCDGTGGPGATNLLTGVATAWTDSTPILVLTGQQPLSHLSKGAFQEIDHVLLFSPISKWSTMLVKPEKAVETLKRAVRIAVSGRPGPVHVNLPVDIQSQHVDYNEEEVSRAASHIFSTFKPCGDPLAIDAALNLLIESFRPVIVSGGGVHYSSRAHRELRELAECLNIPVATTFNGRGSFPEDHPLSVGRIGVHASTFSNKIVSEADVILAVGCRFAALSTKMWSNINPDARLIHIDIDPEIIDRNYRTEVGIVGDAKKVLSEMLERTKKLKYLGGDRREEWLKYIELVREEWRRSKHYSEMFSERSPIKPQRVCAEIRKTCSKETVFTLDAGNNKMWASTFLEIYEPHTWIQSGCFGPMGYAIPAAIACRLALKDDNRSVVAICGDGGFYMSMHEVATAIQENAPILICIFNDGSLGTIKHRQRELYGRRFLSVNLRNPSFADIAEAFGCHGISVETPNQLKSALEDGLRATRRGETAIIDIKIDGEEPLPP